MQQFETGLIVKRQTVQIKGLIRQADLPFAEFLAAHRVPPTSKVKALADRLNYSGDQLGVNLLIGTIIVAAEVYSMLAYSSQMVIQASIMGSVLYAVAISCLINIRRQFILQILAVGGTLTLLLLAVLIDLMSPYFIGGIFSSVSLVFVAKLVAEWQQWFNSDKTNAYFSMESNLIITVFAFWKFYHFTLGNLSLVTYCYDSLLPTIAVIAAIGTIKVYNLFDYDVLHIVNYLQQNTANAPLIDENTNMSHSLAIFVDSLIKNESQQASNQSDPIREDQFMNQTQDLRELSSYQTKRRILATFIIGLVSIGNIIYLIIKRSSWSDSEWQNALVAFAGGSARTLFILMGCQYQKVILAQKKDGLCYFLILFSDCMLVGHCAVFMMFGQSLLNLSAETALVFAISPFLGLRIFSHNNISSHQKLDNSRYFFFFIFYIFPLSLRELISIQGSSLISYILDGSILTYSLLFLTVWSNKDSVITFIREIKTAFKSQQHKTKLFEKMKQININYDFTIQGYLYAHCVILAALSFFISTTSTLKVTFLIFFFAPLLLYAACLVNSHRYVRQLPDTYRPAFLRVLFLLISIAYVVLAYFGVFKSDHWEWSLAVGLNIFLFTCILQGQNLAIVNLHSYWRLLRAITIGVFFLFIYLPFINIFIGGYYVSQFSSRYLYYFSVGGFFYIWMLITLVGVSLHWVLNLTAKSKKDLFIAQYMQSQMRTINMKEDTEKILMIANMYEMLNYKSDNLLAYLKSQKHILVQVRQEKEFSYDYELLEPEDSKVKRLSVVAKPLNPRDLISFLRPDRESVSEDPLHENPVLSFFKQKDRNRLQISRPNDVNDSQLELTRMAGQYGSIERSPKVIERTKQYKEMQAASENQVGETMCKLFNFLTQPSDCLSRESFDAWLQLISGHELARQQSARVFDKFAHSGALNQRKFKEFLADYVEYKYEMKGAQLSAILLTFYCRELLPLMLTPFCRQLTYSLTRQKHTISAQSRALWLNDQTSPQMIEEFQQFKQKQDKKKARLLNKRKQQTIARAEGEDDEDNEVELKEMRGKRQSTLIRVVRQLKDKKLMKAQNVYALLVNSLIECYLYYEKEAQNFRIKTLRFSLSNLLAILTKISDIVFVFGYSTVYLLFAYFQDNFTDSSYLLSSLPYVLLISLAGSSVLIYILLIVYHKKDFETGTLGLDQGLRSLDFKQLKFYTTSILFLLGSGLANYIISIGLNSFLCGDTTLFNFPDTLCYGNTQYIYMLVSLLILVLYWPLSAITFPFSTAMDRSLQIKYKSQYQILYLQFKFLINGYNTLLNPFDYQVQQFINSLLKILVCSALAILYHRMQPCSYEWLNLIEGKIYILLTILSFAGALCYLVGLFFSCIITGSLMALYLVYFIFVTVKNCASLKNQNQENQILEDNIKNQNLKIQIIRQNQQPTVEKQVKEQKKTSGLIETIFLEKNSQKLEESNVKLMSGELKEDKPKVENKPPQSASITNPSQSSKARSMFF